MSVLHKKQACAASCQSNADGSIARRVADTESRRNSAAEFAKQPGTFNCSIGARFLVRLGAPHSNAAQRFRTWLTRDLSFLRQRFGFLSRLSTSQQPADFPVKMGRTNHQSVGLANGEPGERGFLVRPQNVPDLAQAILTLLDNRDQANAIGRRARGLALDRYTWSNYLEKLREVYGRVIGREMTGSQPGIRKAA